MKGLIRFLILLLTFVITLSLLYWDYYNPDPTAKIIVCFFLVVYSLILWWHSSPGRTMREGVIYSAVTVLIVPVIYALLSFSVKGSIILSPDRIFSMTCVTLILLAYSISPAIKTSVEIKKIERLARQINPQQPPNKRKEIVIEMVFKWYRLNKSLSQLVEKVKEVNKDWAGYEQMLNGEVFREFTEMQVVTD